MDQFIITEKCGTIRMLAREALRGRWKLGFIAILVYTAAIYIPTVILTELFSDAPMISTVYSILVGGPFTLGASIFVLSLFRNQEPRVAQIFYGFEKFGKSLGLYLLIVLFVSLWSLIMIPAVVLGVFVPPLMALIAPAMIPAMIAAIRYSQAFFILADHPETGAMECITKSKMLMAGNKMKYFLLCLSFIGWIILASVPLGVLMGILGASEVDMLSYGSSGSFMGLILLASIGFVFVEVYMLTSTAAFYDMVSGNLRPGYIVSTAEVVNEHSSEHDNEHNNENKDKNEDKIME